MNARALIADVTYGVFNEWRNRADKQNYKKKPIQMYNPHKAPLLDHYRSVHDLLRLWMGAFQLIVFKPERPADTIVAGVSQLSCPLHPLRGRNGRA
jgi:hypothetical protein